MSGLSPKLAVLAWIVRAPHGSAVNEECSSLPITIGATGGASSAKVDVPYDGNPNGSGPGAVQNQVVIRIYADRKKPTAGTGIDIRVRFGSSSVADATVDDTLIPYGCWQDFLCTDAKDAAFKIFADVETIGDKAATFYISGFPLSS